VDRALERAGKTIPVNEQMILISGRVAEEGERMVQRRGSGMGHRRDM